MLQNAVDDPASATTVRAIFNLAREAHIEIIVEGVETEAQRAFLNLTSSTTLAQGDYFSEVVIVDQASNLQRSGAIGQSPDSGNADRCTSADGAPAV